MGKGSSASPAERPLSQQELDLISTQEDALKQSMDVYTKQFNLSETDRAYFDKIYRGDLDPNDPRVKEEVAKRIQDTPQPTKDQFMKAAKVSLGGDGEGVFGKISVTPELDQEAYDTAMKKWEEDKAKIVAAVSSELGGKGVDEALFESVMASDTKIQTAFADWQSKAQTLGTKYTDSITGISKDFTNKLTAASEAMGTANADIYAQTKGQNLAGISQSYAEARKQLEGTLAQRGMSDSGVGIGALSTSYNQEAMAKANALSASYQQAIQQSDIQRQNQLGIAGQLYNTGNQTAQTAYGVQSGLDTASLQNTLNANQQNIANLTSMSGVSQGVYGGASNYLNQSGQTAGQAAATAGSTAVGIGNTNVSWANAQTQANAAETAGMYGAIGTIAGMGTSAYINKYSDFRFKNNITYVETINGIRYYTWEWNDFAKEYMTEEKLYEPYGVIAQELRITNPELVFEDENGYLFVDYTSLKEI